MKNGWGNVLLGDIMKIMHGFAFKGEYFSEEGDFVLLTPGNFQEQGGLKLKGDKEKYYTGDFPYEYVFKKGDLVVAMTDLVQSAPILGSCAIIPEDNKYLHNQRLGKIIDIDAGRIEKKYLHYVFNSEGVRNQIKGSATGSTVKHTAPERIYKVKASLPPIKQQKEIASILSAYDDLIENNTRQIKILEEMARLIYREWFIEWNIPVETRFNASKNTDGNETRSNRVSTKNKIRLRKATPEEKKVTGKDVFPEGWKIKNLFDVAEVTYGFPFKGKLFIDTPIGKPIIRIRNLKEQKSSTYSSEIPSEKYLLKNGDILVGMDGDFTVNIWAGGEAYLNQRNVRFRPKDGLPILYLASSLEKPIHFYDSTVVGTTVAHLSDDDLRSINMVVPDQSFVKTRMTFLEEIVQMRINLIVRNTNLRQTRDLLLPKLISGEVEV